MTPAGASGDKMQGNAAAVEVSAFDLGRLFARMDSLDERMIEVKREHAASVEKLEQRIETRMGQFAEALEKLAAGYVRHEQLAKLERDIDAIAQSNRKNADRIGALEIQGGRSEPILRHAWELIKYLAIAGLGAAGAHLIPHL